MTQLLREILASVGEREPSWDLLIVQGREGVVFPEGIPGEIVLLNMGRGLGRPPRAHYGPAGLEVLGLSFSGSVFRCFFPWASIHGIRTPGLTLYFQHPQDAWEPKPPGLRVVK